MKYQVTWDRGSGVGKLDTDSVSEAQATFNSMVQRFKLAVGQQWTVVLYENGQRIRVETESGSVAPTLHKAGTPWILIAAGFGLWWLFRR